MDREETLRELKRLAEILWRAHRREMISPDDKQSVYNILFGRTVLFSRHIAANAIVQAIFEVTDDFDFTINTVRQLLPEIVVAHPMTVVH